MHRIVRRSGRATVNFTAILLGGEKGEGAGRAGRRSRLRSEWRYFLRARIVNPVQRRSHTRKHPPAEENEWSGQAERDARRDRADEAELPPTKSETEANAMKY